MWHIVIFAVEGRAVSASLVVEVWNEMAVRQVGMLSVAVGDRDVDGI
jgi:hypothetical protein